MNKPDLIQALKDSNNLSKSELLADRFNDFCFCQGHFEYPLRVRWLELFEFVKDTGFGGNCQRI